ncbi:MAG: NAD-dependent epimerase/dehydratase family protein [Candidatus Geothermincolia bacterium]
MKTDIVTGGCGLSGTYLVKHLVEQGHKVRATDLASSYDSQKAQSLRRAVDLDFKRDGVEWVPSDLTNKKTLGPVFKGEVGCLYHTASLYDYSAPWEALEKVNIKGVTNLLDAAEKGSIERMVHWSTCGVYGHPHFPGSYLEGKPHRPTQEFLWNVLVRPWQETGEFKRPSRKLTNQPMVETRSNPKNTDGDTPENTYFSNEYSRSKWIQEQLVWKRYREKGLPVTVVRPAPIYGPGSDYGVTGLLIELSEGLLPVYPAASKFLMFGGNVHASDMARAAIFLSETPASIGEDYNVADSHLLTHREAIETVSKLLGRRVRFIPGMPLPVWQQFVKGAAALNYWLEDSFPRYTRSRVLDKGQITYLTMGIWISNRKIKNLGFEFEYADFRDGLADTIAWLIEDGKIK